MTGTVEQVKKVLGKLEERLEGLELKDLDVEFSETVMNIQPKNSKPILITFHQPSGQIWVSSPISGATYFTFSTEKADWVRTHNPSQSLFDLISEELSQMLSTSVQLKDAQAC